MKVVVTGGMGFLGHLLAKRILERGEIVGPSGNLERVDKVLLVDAVGGRDLSDLPGAFEYLEGDIRDLDFVASVVDDYGVSVFHLASMVSAGCEADFDGALDVNVRGTRTLLEACRAFPGRSRCVFASSIATYGGGQVAGVVDDNTKLTPETTYGMTKAICELLVNDYSRKGFVDGRSARLPTVVIRPGRPNAAASSWVSGLFREPLAGENYVIPVDLMTRVPITGYRTVVENLVRLHDVPGAALGADRACNLPALNLSAGEMIETLHEVSGRPLGSIRVEPDPATMAIFRGWATRSAFDRAAALGLLQDPDLGTIIAEYLEDFGRTPA